MQRAAEGHGSDRFDVRTVLIHDEKLEGWSRVVLRGNEAVSVGGERDASAGKRTGTEVQYARGDAVVRSVRRSFSVGQSLDGPCLEVDAVDVRFWGSSGASTPALRELVELGEVDPLPVKRDDRIGHRAAPAFDQHFLGAPGMEQDEVSAGVGTERKHDLGPVGVLLVAEPRRPHVDDVVGEAPLPGSEWRGRGV